MQHLIEQIEALDNHQFKELLDQIKRLKRKRIKAIAAEAQRKIAELGNDIDLSFASKGKKRKVKVNKPPKYQNPANSDEQWSGYGRQPDWFKTYLKRGGKKEDLLI